MNKQITVTRAAIIIYTLSSIGISILAYSMSSTVLAWLSGVMMGATVLLAVDEVERS